MSDPVERMRLDKWLWAARFYKTRAMAAEAVEGGKVHLNGQRTKPGKDVRIGSRIEISKGGLEWQIEVAVLPRQRRPAAEAVGFYVESDDSR
jgi:ribosome-associated heat shock protein Hsp15